MQTLDVEGTTTSFIEPIPSRAKTYHIFIKTIFLCVTQTIVCAMLYCVFL